MLTQSSRWVITIEKREQDNGVFNDDAAVDVSYMSRFFSSAKQCQPLRAEETT